MMRCRCSEAAVRKSEVRNARNPNQIQMTKSEMRIWRTGSLSDYRINGGRCDPIRAPKSKTGLAGFLLPLCAIKGDSGETVANITRNGEGGVDSAHISLYP